jgi:hypothetical protein
MSHLKNRLQRLHCRRRRGWAGIGAGKVENKINIAERRAGGCARCAKASAGDRAKARLSGKLDHRGQAAGRACGQAPDLHAQHAERQAGRKICRCGLPQRRSLALRSRAARRRRRRAVLRRGARQCGVFDPCFKARWERETERCRSSRLALLLLDKGVGALRQFLRREVFLVRGDIPAIAGRILHAAAAVTVEHVRRFRDRLAAGLDR